MDDFEQDWADATGGMDGGTSYGYTFDEDWIDRTLGLFADGGYSSAEPFVLDSWMANMSPENLSSVLADNNATMDTASLSETNNGSSETGSGTGSGASWGQTAMNAINGLGSWANQNRTLAGLLGSGLLGALRGNNSPDYAAAIKEKEQVDLRTRQRISDSITGMAPITVNRPGLLKTMSGQNVYDQNGRIAR